MSEMTESVERYRNAQRSHEWKHQVWTSEAWNNLAAYLAAEMAEHPGVSVVATRGLSEEGYEVLWFHLRGHDHGYNTSHPCPPFADCNGGG